MNWRKVKINVNRITGDAVINIMEELGAQGVVFEENKEKLDSKKKKDFGNDKYWDELKDEVEDE